MEVESEKTGPETNSQSTKQRTCKLILRFLLLRKKIDQTERRDFY